MGRLACMLTFALATALAAGAESTPPGPVTFAQVEPVLLENGARDADARRGTYVQVRGALAADGRVVVERVRGRSCPRARRSSRAHTRSRPLNPLAP